MDYDKEVHDLRLWRERLEDSVFISLMIQLDAASMFIMLAKRRHGLGRIEHLQNACRVYEAISKMYSSRLLENSHRKEIDDRLDHLESTLRTLGAARLAEYLP